MYCHILVGHKLLIDLIKFKLQKQLRRGMAKRPKLIGQCDLYKSTSSFTLTDTIKFQVFTKKFYTYVYVCMYITFTKTCLAYYSWFPVVTGSMSCVDRLVSGIVPVSTKDKLHWRVRDVTHFLSSDELQFLIDKKCKIWKSAKWCVYYSMVPKYRELHFLQQHILLYVLNIYKTFTEKNYAKRFTWFPRRVLLLINIGYDITGSYIRFFARFCKIDMEFQIIQKLLWLLQPFSRVHLSINDQ